MNELRRRLLIWPLLTTSY